MQFRKNPLDLKVCFLTQNIKIQKNYQKDVALAQKLEGKTFRAKQDTLLTQIAKNQRDKTVFLEPQIS